MTILDAKKMGDGIRQEMEKVLVGRSDTIQKVLCALFAGGHVLMEDVPGTGKTMLARSLSACLSLPFGRIQFTPDLLPGDVTGSSVYHMQDEKFVFHKGPIFAGIVLADELNRATPRTQSALLEAMEERQVTVDGVTRPLPKPFIVIATQNPVESSGTFPLPEAQLDRFLMRLQPGYPTQEEEIAMMERFLNGNPLAECRAAADAEAILEGQRLAGTVEVSPDVRRYLAQIVDATRTENGVLLGASPRALLALMRACQAWALLDGRAYVIPDDAQCLAADVLSHRLVLSSGGWDANEPRRAVEKAVEKVDVPTEKVDKMKG